MTKQELIKRLKKTVINTETLDEFNQVNSLLSEVLVVNELRRVFFYKEMTCININNGALLDFGTMNGCYNGMGYKKISAKEFLSWFDDSKTINVSGVKVTVETPKTMRQIAEENIFGLLSAEKRLFTCKDGDKTLCEYSDGTYKTNKELTPQEMLLVVEWVKRLEKKVG